MTPHTITGNQISKSTIRNKQTVSKKFNLDKANGKLMGVCSSLSNWSGLDVNLIRILFALATIFGFGSAIVIYIIIGLVAD